MCREKFCAAVLLLSLTGACAAATYVVPTTTLAAQTANNTSAASSFSTQSNGNLGAGNVSKVDVHSLLYPGATSKVYAHLVMWFGGSNHMNVGYSSTDPTQVHKQITDMISRGIDGVILDWYGPNNSIDQAAKLVMAEAESHPGFTFAIMIDQGAIKWDSCSGCSPQQALINQLQYVEQTYFPSPAYMRQQGRPIVTNFAIDDSYTVDWPTVNAALSTQPLFLFQNNGGFSHLLSDGSYSWVMPTTTDYGKSYLTSFYDTGMTFTKEQTLGAAYKGFNDSLAAWGSGRVMGQQCGQTWFQTFSEINSLYNSGKQLSALQLVTWNDYEEATEIESGINNCLSLSAAVSGTSLQWTAKGDPSTVDHYVAYISTDAQNLMALAEVNAATNSMNLCSYPIPNGSYTLYVQAVGKPSIVNQMSAPVKFSASCQTSTSGSGTMSGGTSLTFGTNPSTLTISSGGSGNVTVTAAPSSGSFNSAIALACSGLPQNLACSFSPASITPGGGAVSSVLTIAAAKATATGHRERNNFLTATWLVSFGLFGLILIGKVERERIVTVLGTCALAAMIVGGASCGGGGKTSSSVVNTPSATVAAYTITVQGSASAVQLSTTVAVTVQ
ncbi:MAG TPA: endo-1,3-alpha-glucanase family glycosylhydrolase [Candidatus Sulfotelmatobacter sp.]